MIATTQASPIEELCDIKRAVTVTGQSKAFIYRHMDDAQNPFPRPKRIGRKSFWRMSDLQAWIAAEWTRSERVGRGVGQPNR